MRKIFLVLLLINFTACDNLPEWMKQWQKKQMEKRYGSAYEQNADKTEDWEEDVLEYEEIIDEKIKAGDNAAKLYRKIGESYAKVGSFEKCIENIEKAISLGYTDPSVFFTLGLCYGNLARIHNWEKNNVRKAEEAFLKVLNQDEHFYKAKFQLSLLYFYGYASKNRFSIEYEGKYLESEKFRKKGLELMEEYRKNAPHDPQGYFALAGYYTLLKMPNKAAEEYTSLIHVLQKDYGKKASSMTEYQQAMQNLSKLNRSLGKKNEKPVIIQPER